MKHLIASILMVVTLSATAQKQLPGKVHFGLIYPISTNGNHAAQDTNSLSIHLIAGVSAAERGAAFAGLSNVVVNDVEGPLFAGFSNHVGKTVDGPLFAGFLNTYGGGHAPAFSGFLNVSTGPTKAAQLSGFANVSRDVEGIQASGFINTAKDLNGTQIAGFINLAKKVKGAQIAGFINIADSSDHPIGIINIIKNGEKGMGITWDENRTAMLSLRSGGKVLYGIIGIGYNFENKDEKYAMEAGFGAHFFQSSIFRLNAEASVMTLEDFKAGEYFKTSLRLMPSLKVGKFMELFAGPSFNYVNTNTYEGRKLQKKYVHEWQNKWGGDFQGLYFGYTGGINFIF